MVAVNLSDLVREELAVALEATNNVMIVSDLVADSVVHQPTVVGRLDSALRETLKAIERLPESDAPILAKVVPDLGLSAANNRLASLVKKGILTSEKRGGKRIYRPVMENLQYGN